MLTTKLLARNCISLTPCAGFRYRLTLLARMFQSRRIRDRTGADNFQDRIRRNPCGIIRQTSARQQKQNEQYGDSHLTLQLAMVTPQIMIRPPHNDIVVRRSPRKIAANKTPTIGVR